MKEVSHLEFLNFEEFCKSFDIKNSKVAGEDGFDEELIIEELNKIGKHKWVLNFMNNKQEGYFRLQFFA